MMMTLEELEERACRINEDKWGVEAFSDPPEAAEARWNMVLDACIPAWQEVREYQAQGHEADEAVERLLRWYEAVMRELLQNKEGFAQCRWRLWEPRSHKPDAS